MQGEPPPTTAAAGAPAHEATAHEATAHEATVREAAPPQGPRPVAPPRRAFPAAPVAPGLTVQAPLGAGAMGEVWRVWDPGLARSLALKVMRVELAGVPELAARFIREAQVTGSLEHDGVPPVHTLGHLSDGRPYYTMKELQGRSLGDRVSSRRESKDDIVAWLAEVAATLVYAHSQEVTHRDIKPDNVLIGPFGEVTLLDWGLARRGNEPLADSLPVSVPVPPLSPARLVSPLHNAPLVEDEGLDGGEGLGQGEGGGSGFGSMAMDWSGSSSDSAATRVGAVLGTPGFMAPEQEAGEAVGPPTDIYALGVTLLAALSGRRGPVKVPPPGLDPGLAAIGVAALAREPGERPTAAQMERELRGWLEAARAKARSEARAQRGEALLGAASAKGQAELIELLVRLADRDGRSRARPRASLVSLSSEAAGHVEALLAAGLLSAEEDQLAWSSASLPQEWGRLGAALAAEGPGLSLRERLADALPGADGPPSRAEPPWQGALLAEALAWRARARPLLDAAEAAFLDRSALAERRADRRRMLALVLAVALLSGLGLGFGALWLDTRRAWDQEGQARQAAEGRGLFALGREAEGLRRPHEALAYYLAAADLGAEGAREAAWQVGAAGVASWVVPVARGGVWDVAVDPELGSLFVTAADGKVREIDPATGALQRSFGPPDVELLDVIVRADRLYAYGWPRGVRVWSRAGGEELPRLDAGIRAKGGMRQTPLGPLLTAARDGRLRTWDPETGALLGEAHRGARAFRTALRGDLCAVVDAKKDGGLYRLPDLRSIWEGARVGSAGVAFAGDEALYFDSRGRVTRVNAEGEARESRLLGVPELDGVWSAEEGVVLSSGNGWVGVLDPTAQALDRVLPGGRGTFTDFAFAGDELVGVGDEGGLVWGFSDGRLHARLDGHTGPVKAGAWLPGARRLATVSLDGTARLWDLGDAADGARWLERGGPVRTAWSAGRLNPVTAWCTVGGSCAARDSQGHRWTLPAEAEIIGTGEGWVASYDPAQRRVELFGERGALAQLPVETAPTGAEYQPDVHRLAITYPDGRLDLWDQEPFLASGRRRMSSIGEPSGWHIDLARDRLLVLRHDHTAALYRLSDGAKLADLDPGSASLYSASQWAATSTLGQVLVASSEGGALRFNVEDGRALAPLPDSRRLVSIQVSPDGEVAATTTYDRKVRLWSLRGGDLLFEAGPFDHLLDTALFSPSGRRLAVLDGGGDLRVWDLPTRHLLRHLYVGEGRDRALAFLSEDDLAAGVAGDWSRYHLDNAPADPATLTNFRVCRSTQRVVAVVPFPGAGSPWAPSPDCAGRREVGADGAAGSAETAE